MRELELAAFDQSLQLVATAPYSGQFLLGPARVEIEPSWKTTSVAGSLVLTAHPHLPIVQVESEDKHRQLTLVGEILDPRVPGRGNRDILETLLDRLSTKADVIEATFPLGGRWVLIVKNGDDVFLFHDAMGLRQVFHTGPRLAQSPWVMSQPGIAIDLLGLSMDPEAEAFVDSLAFRSNTEYRWPASASPIRGLKRLLPNHVLDLKFGTVERYWPAAPLQEMSADAAVDALSKTLPGMIRAITSRHDVALSLTAGLDSRLVLAAARDVMDRVTCVTVRQSKMSDSNPDVVIPSRLLARLNLSHQLIRAPATTSPEFSRRFKQNVFFAHEGYGPDAEAIQKYSGGARVALTGSGAEIGRCPFRSRVPRSKRSSIDAHQLAKLQRMGSERFALKSFDVWLEDARERFNVNILDLFDWEQGHGSWLAMTQLEFNIAWRDIFTPYNSRELLTTLMSVNESERESPDYRIFRRLIGELWPELLQEPINPQPTKAWARKLRRGLSMLSEFLI
jgi:hypothetical protein